MTLGYYFSVFLCLVLVTGANCVNAQGHGYQSLTIARFLDGLRIDSGSIRKGGAELSDSKGLSGFMTKSAQGTRSSSTREGQSKIVPISPRARYLTPLLEQKASLYSNYGSSHKTDIAVKSGTIGSHTRAVGRETKFLRPVSKSIMLSQPGYKSGFAPRAGSQNLLSLSAAGLHRTMKQDPELKSRLFMKVHLLGTEWQSQNNGIYGSAYGTYDNKDIVKAPPRPLNPAIDTSFPPQEGNPDVYEAARTIQQKSSSIGVPAQSGPTDIDLSHELRGYAQVTRLKLAVDLPTPRGFNHRMSVSNSIHSRKPATSSSVHHGFTKATGTGNYKPGFENAKHSESPLDRFHIESYGPRGFRPWGKFKPFQHSPPTSEVSPVTIMMVPEHGVEAEPDNLRKATQVMASNEKSDQDMKLGPYRFNKASQIPSPATTTVLHSDSPSWSTFVPTSTNSLISLASPYTEITPAEMPVPKASINPPEGHPGSHGISATQLTEQLDPKLVASSGTDLELNLDDDYSGEDPDKNPKEKDYYYDDEDLYVVTTMSPVTIDVIQTSTT